MKIEVRFLLVQPFKPLTNSCACCQTVVARIPVAIQIFVADVPYILLTDEPVACPHCSATLDCFASFPDMKTASARREQISDQIRATKSIEFLKLLRGAIEITGGCHFSNN